MGGLTVPATTLSWKLQSISDSRYQDANHAAKVNLIRPVGDMAEEVLQQLVAHGRYLRAGVSEDGEEGVEELGEKADGARVRHTVQHTDPGDQELTDKPGQKND